MTLTIYTCELIAPVTKLHITYMSDGMILISFDSLFPGLASRVENEEERELSIRTHKPLRRLAGLEDPPLYDDLIDMEDDLLDDEGMEDLFSMDIGDRDMLSMFDPYSVSSTASGEHLR